MEKVDLAIKSKKVFIDNRLMDCWIGVKEGKIVNISAGKIAPAVKTIDFKEKYILPGGIDPHVHVRDYEDLSRNDERVLKAENYETVTRAAAAGGVTTIIAMPIRTPPPYSTEIVKRRMQRAKEKIIVDMAFIGGAGSDHLEEIIPCSHSGIVAFKTFLHEAPEGKQKDYEGMTAPQDGDLFEVMRRIAKTQILAAFHAENNSLIKKLIKGFTEEGKISPIYHVKSRPPIAEIESTSTILLFAEELGLQVQLCHISTSRAVELVNMARRRGVKAFVETCPQYLMLDEEYLNRYGVYAKCNPPLRTKEEVERMWEMVNNGSIDTIGSDHAPQTVEEKEKGRENIFKSTSGFPGVEQRLPLLFTKVKERKLKLERMIELICTNPAKIFGLYPKKGAIGIGADADFVIIDPDRKDVIERKNMFTAVRESARVYEGMKVYGTPETTILRGNIVYDLGKVLIEPGYGQILKYEKNERKG
jgi:dihydropyrimidinase/allantoinase